MIKSNKIYLSLECLLIFWVTPMAIAAFRLRSWMYIMLWVAALLAWRWLEHALYGCMIFTLGLGYYFYHGQAVH
ncbi:MAG: hypothetical protein ABL857_04905 [Rickettsiales bacterium]